MGKLTENNWHNLLLRQLKKTQSSIDATPNRAQWKSILAMINDSYCETDKQKYLLERSMHLASDEMRKLYRQVTENAEKRIQHITDTYPDMLMLLSEDSIVLDLLSSSGFEEILIDQYDAETNMPIEFLLEGNLAAIIRHKINHFENLDSEQVFNYIVNNSSNDIVYEIRLIAAKSHSSTNIFCLIRDISDLAKSKKELEYLVLHDPLTALPNRLFFYQTLKATINSCDNDSIGGVIFFDLDRFKSVNDSLGHRIGDQLIIAVAQRISLVLNKNEFLARMSGDEFIVIAKNVRHETDVFDCANRILASFDQPFDLEEHWIEVKASIGISLFPEHSLDTDELTQYADTAMYSAKEKGGNQFNVFSKKQTFKVQRNFQIEQELRRAIVKDEVYMVYQPQFCTQSGDVSGFESLIRWQPKDRGVIPPSEFIPIAELTGFINELGLWIINTVCSQIRKWKQDNIVFKKVSINLSRSQLTDPELAKSIFNIMRKNNVKSTEIVFEITEDSIIKNNQAAMDNLNLLHQVGINIAIDDFGSGYSSFFDLKRFPFSELKIDKSIIDGIGTKTNDDAIVRAIIAMGRELGMQVVAEGVESNEQLDFLRLNHCQVTQGYLLGKPLTVNQAESLISNNRKIIQIARQNRLLSQ